MKTQRFCSIIDHFYFTEKFSCHFRSTWRAVVSFLPTYKTSPKNIKSNWILMRTLQQYLVQISWQASRKISGLNGSSGINCLSNPGEFCKTSGISYSKIKNDFFFLNSFKCLFYNTLLLQSLSFCFKYNAEWIEDEIWDFWVDVLIKITFTNF